MKNSVVIVKLNMGPVLDETIMSPEDFTELVKVLDLNSCEVEPVYHILTDIDTGGVVSVQQLQTKPLTLDAVVSPSL